MKKTIITCPIYGFQSIYVLNYSRKLVVTTILCARRWDFLWMCQMRKSLIALLRTNSNFKIMWF